MKNKLTNVLLSLTISILIFVSNSCDIFIADKSINKEMKMENDQINLSSGPIRGKINEIEENRYRYDYYDVYEKDSDYEFLSKKGYQGGGPSWEGIIYGLLKKYSPETIKHLDFDAEGEGIAIWSSDKNSLEIVGRLVNHAKNNKNIMLKAIDVASREYRME